MGRLRSGTEQGAAHLRPSMHSGLVMADLASLREDDLNQVQRDSLSLCATAGTGHP